MTGTRDYFLSTGVATIRNANLYWARVSVEQSAIRKTNTDQALSIKAIELHVAF